MEIQETGPLYLNRRETVISWWKKRKFFLYKKKWGFHLLRLTMRRLKKLVVFEVGYRENKMEWEQRNSDQ
jgi:hypothetical protein